ncbi:MAG: DUF308 domain-containing protein [Actinomycetia bacterium]|nr:DUF308 domain-containing protein [Actinomycetes bacterium]
MLIVALVLAVVGLAALVTAVITSNELIAWVCIAASAIGVLLLIIDAVRSRSQQNDGDDETDGTAEPEVIYDEDYPEEAPVGADYGAPAQDAPTQDAPEEASHGDPAGKDSTKS